MTQLNAFLRKSVIVKRKYKCCLCCEIALPIFLIGLSAVLKNLYILPLFTLFATSSLSFDSFKTRRFAPGSMGPSFIVTPFSHRVQQFLASPISTASAAVLPDLASPEGLARFNSPAIWPRPLTNSVLDNDRVIDPPRRLWLHNACTSGCSVAFNNLVSVLEASFPRYFTRSQVTALPLSDQIQTDQANFAGGVEVYSITTGTAPSLNYSIRLPKNARNCGANRLPCLPTTEPNDFFTGRSTMQYLYESITAPGNIGWRPCDSSAPPSLNSFGCQLTDGKPTTTNSNARRHPSGQVINEGQPYQYLSTGFTAVQLAVQCAMFSVASGRTGPCTDSPQPAMPSAISPYPTYAFTLRAGAVVSNLLAYSWIPFVSALVQQMLKEKEARIKEIMFIMGFQPRLFWFGWTIVALISGTLISFIIIVGGALVLFPATAFINILMATIGMLLASISFSFLIYTLVDRSQFGNIIALVWMVASVILYPIVETEVTPNGMAGFGWNFVMACYRSYTLMETGVSAFVPGYNLSVAIMWLYIDAVVYLLLAWYLDKVFPGEYGIKYPALFPFMKSYWFPSSADSSVEMHASKQRKDSRFEDESFQDCKIQVDGLVKVFRKNPFKASEFDKKAVNGIVFGMRSGEIFSLLGHNGAGKTTTINMLCGLYEATAGDATVFGRSIRTDMAAIRRSIGFCPQHDVLYPELTVWEHLEFYGRIKGVAEAQLQSEVAHRIGQVGLGGKEHNTGDQLSGGMKRKLSLAIAYLGNSSFVILDEPTAGLDPVSRRFVWDIIQLNKHDKVTLLTTHFMDEADILGDRIGIVANGIMKCCGSSPFLKSRYGIGYHLDFAFPSDFKNVSPVNHAQFIEKIVPGSKQDTGIGSEISFLLPLQGTPHFPQLLRQLDAHKGDLGHESVGLSLTTLEEVFLRVADDADEFHGVGARPDKESPADDVVVTINPSGTPKRRRSSVSQQKKSATLDQQSLLKDVDVEPAGGSHEDHFVAIFARRLLQFSPSRNPFNFLFNVVFPVVIIIVAGAVGSNSSQQLVTYPFLLMSPSKALNGNPAVTTIYNAGSSIAEVPPLTVRQQPSTAALIDTLNAKNQNPSSNANMDSAFSFDTTSLKYGLYINRQYTHALPVSLNYLASNFQRTDGQPAVTFTLYSAPLPFRVNTSANGVVTFLLLVMLAFSFVPGYVVSKAVSERVSKARHLLRVMGMRSWIYWTSNFVFDFVYMIIFSIVSIICAYSFNIQGLSSNSKAVFTITLFWTSIVSVVFCYLLSFFFSNSTSAQLAVFSLVFMFGVMGGVFFNLFNILAVQLPDGARNTMTSLATVTFSICGLLPQFHIIAAALSSSIPPASFTPTLTSSWDKQPLSDTISRTYAANSFIYLGILTIFLSFILFAIESPGLRVYLGPILDKLRAGECFKSPLQQQFQPQHQPQQIDEDVAAEASRMSTHNGNITDILELHGISKIYPASSLVPEKKAVDNISLGIRTGEVFGLLGGNGAGKTTLMSMMTNDYLPTSGLAYVNFVDVHKQPRKAFKVMGYCPQFDALWPDVTAREHLATYGRIKGYSGDRLKGEVDSMLKKMSLENYADKLAGDFSGGNKRKLSVAIALLADPKVVYLDEPSTGMDPASRRFMWSIIAESMQSRAVVLTTHSMEEADALCTRIGIMVNGKLQCLGSSQHLKSKFGKGCVVQMRVPPELEQAAVEFVCRNFVGAVLKQNYRGALSFDVPSLSINLADAFELFESSKQNLRIIDYSLSQTTLEQVFLSFAALQKNSDLGSALGDSAAVAGGPLPMAYPVYGAPLQFQTQPNPPQ